MKIGVGLPATVPDLSPEAVLDWAAGAEDYGFSTLGVLDRLAYQNYEPLVTLAAAAALTSHTALAATVLIAPYRQDVALLAKQAATVHELSGGRLTLGVSAGLREDDFAVSGAPFRGRGKRLDAMIETCHAVWAGEHPGPDNAVGPALRHGKPALMIGGNSEAALHRAARYGDGWVAGASSPAQYAKMLGTARRIWAEHGRTEPLRTQAVAFFALGPDAESDAERYLRRYYAFLGPHSEMMLKKAATDEDRLAEVIDAYRQAGCDELVFFPCSADIRQLDLLTKATR
ncbi:LLM class flavin-dependent oxidoreductase [Amycolatopsis sp. NPDC059021]|uniref:LLM class flavin-dependent oxidoreductase n=1 Tax=Amycolatopsis sp. NPDC059021 TaxID=3346704 RepID=UPI0036707D3B